MVICAFPRRRRDLVAPFEGDGQFCDLTVERCETSTFPDAAWANYQHDGERNSLVNKQVGFYRATFVPSLAASLARADDPAARQAFSDRLEFGLKQRLLAHPAPMNTLVETIVLAKLDSAKLSSRPDREHANQKSGRRPWSVE